MFKVIETSSTKTFEEELDELLSQGYTLINSALSTDVDGDGRRLFFYQALLEKSETKLNRC